MFDNNANAGAKIPESARQLSQNTEKASGSNGLENVIAADTVLSRVDGERGELLIRGLPLESVAGVIPFEGTCRLLWTGDPTSGIDLLRSQLGLERARAFELLPQLGSALQRPDAMEALRAALAQLRDCDEPVASRAEQGIRITAAVAVFAAAWARLHHADGPQPAVEPDPRLGHAEDYLRMLAGASARAESSSASPPPSSAPGSKRSPEPGVGPRPGSSWERRTAALDSYLSTVAEHGMNASTFAARVVASTGSDRISAVVAALCALKGPLHGGAPGPVLDMIDDIGEPSAARAWLETELRAGRRIMGLGHRVYRVRDPRAAVLEAAVLDLHRAGFESPRLGLARAVEREAQILLREHYPNRPLETNVEFYTAVLLDGIGLDRRLFSPTFAVARVAGWLAHIDEQRLTGRLIRPRSRYIGPTPESA